MARDNARKKGRDTKRQEKLQEHHCKLMESLRSLLSGEVSFLLPAMVGISHLSKLGEKTQALLLVAFLLMAYFSTVSLILSHCTHENARRCSAVVSAMALTVTVFCLGIFHLAIALLTPEAKWEGSVFFNISMFLGGVLLISLRWKTIFQPPECDENLPFEEVKCEDTKCHTNLQEHHNRRMESFRSLLSGEVFFLLPAMAGISNLDKLGEAIQAILLCTFLVIGDIGTVGLILSHSTNSMKWSSLVSFCTLTVTVYWLGIFHLTIALMTPQAYQEVCYTANFFLFLGGSRLIRFLWKNFSSLQSLCANEETELWSRVYGGRME